MPHVVELLSAEDPRVADYAALNDVDLRTRFEPPRGLFIAEGELVLRRAVAAGYRLRSVLTSPKWLPQLDELDLGGAPVYVAAPALLERLTGFHVHRGLLASVHRPDPAPVERLLATSRRLAVLENINNHTNLGAIFRCAAGLGMDGVLLSPSCTDPLYRRSVRVSVGEVFAVPWARATTWPQPLRELAEQGFTVLALTPDPTAVPLSHLDLSRVDRRAVVLGAEGRGLSRAALALAQTPVRIPMHGGVDSLNVAAAAAVTFFVVAGDSQHSRSPTG